MSILDAEKNFQPNIGIVVALECEYLAALEMLQDQLAPVRHRGPTGFRSYRLGHVEAHGGGRHKVVLTVSGVGNNKSTAKAVNLFSDFPSVEEVIMLGIAGGVPGLLTGQVDIRLGDVIVSDAHGVVQVDFGKSTITGFKPQEQPRPASHDWYSLAQDILNQGTQPSGYWSYLDDICTATSCSRPETDVLMDDDRVEESPRQLDLKRTHGRPLARIGRIGSGGEVVKSTEKREWLRETYGIVAIEMEGSGIAEAAWQAGRTYTIVRGICDYANDGKKKAWQPYASAAAAAFTKFLLGNMPLRTTG